VIRPGASAPPVWSTWIIRGDGHSDPRAHLFVSELVASESKRITGKDGRIAVPSRQRLQKWPVRHGKNPRRPANLVVQPVNRPIGVHVERRV
jgi:hypothetical protein